MIDEFPILKKIAYLDSAASAQKPETVIKFLDDFYENSYANVHRGIHELGVKATEAYEGARKIVADFINSDEKQVIFTKSTTEAINLLASTLCWDKDATIITTEVEHHSNFIPWQQLAKRLSCKIKFIPQKDGNLDLAKAREMIEEGCSLLAIHHVSNVTGEVIPIKELTKLVHEQGGIVVVDGAQAAPHVKIDVEDLDVDAYAFSSHKMYGPSGVGVLYGKKELLESIPPYQFGGEMIHDVSKEDSVWASIPHKFEAGTPPIAQAVGFGKAIEWFKQHDLFSEQEVVDYAYKELSKIPEVNIIGSDKRVALISFNVKDIHSHDVAQFLSDNNVAIRAGHHCTQVLHECLGLTDSCRASFGIYSTKEHVDQLTNGIKKCVEAFNVS